MNITESFLGWSCCYSSSSHFRFLSVLLTCMIAKWRNVSLLILRCSCVRMCPNKLNALSIWHRNHLVVSCFYPNMVLCGIQDGPHGHERYYRQTDLHTERRSTSCRCLSHTIPCNIFCEGSKEQISVCCGILQHASKPPPTGPQNGCCSMLRHVSTVGAWFWV